jgi:hypothetical protein
LGRDKAPRKAVIPKEVGITNLNQKKAQEPQDPCAFCLINPGGLHVVQRAAAPASEPTPIAVDVVSRAVSPASIEEIPAATAHLIRIGVFFRPTTALFIRLFAGCFISHNVVLSLVVVVLPAPFSGWRRTPVCRISIS